MDEEKKLVGMTFAEQVDAVLSGADTTSSHLEVLKVTPPLLRMVGVPNLPILMTANHLKTITQDSGIDSANYHGLGAELVKRLPELISDPVMIMDSISPDANAENSIVIVTQMVDKQNRPIIGAIKLNGVGRQDSKIISANILTSAYGKDNFQSFIKRNIERGSVLYVDKEKSQALSVNPGIQFPDVMANLSFNTIIRKTNAFVNSQGQEKSTRTKNSQGEDDHSRALPTKLKENTKKNQEKKMDIPTTDVIEQARERARHLVQETGEPYVTIERSESSELNAGDVMSLSEADKKLASLDGAHLGGNYDRVKLSIDYVKNGKADSYEDCIFDIGDEQQQGLVSHIQEYWQFYLENKNWRKRLESQHSSDYVNSMYEQYDYMANDMAPFFKRHVELSDMVTKAKSADMTAEEVEEVQTFVRQSRSEMNGMSVTKTAAAEIQEKGIIGKVTAAPEGEAAPIPREPINYRDKVNTVRDEMAQTLLDYIEQNPQDWQKGWNSLTAPINGKTNKSYRGFNALYLSLVGIENGYKDPRWVTFSQAKDLGASIKKGEKSSPVLFFEFYDRLTKKAYDSRTTKDMTDEERAVYEKENVYAVLKYSSVFNASQCTNFPERDLESLKMSEEERANQNALIENIIANSAAPVNYDGGNRAYYSPSSDSIHLPEIDAFNSMQDYYATALHEIAHSTGHASRLNRDLSGKFGSTSYAVEELRAELACVYMQIEQGIQLEGKHIENHAAYLNSWLEAAKNDKSIFFKAASDAQKIADYVSEHYLQSVQVDELELEDEAQKNVLESRLNANVREWYQSAFPTDELGAELDGGLTFKDVLGALSKGDNIYDVLGAYDSVVRERLFSHLAEIQDKSYEEIYNAWTNAGTQQEGEHEEKNVKLNVDIYNANALYRNYVSRTIEAAHAETRQHAAETGEPYITIESVEHESIGDNIAWFKSGMILPLSDADRIFENLNKDFVRDGGTSQVKINIDFIFEGEPCTITDFPYCFGAEKGGLVEAFILDAQKPGTSPVEKDHAIYFQQHKELSAMVDKAIADDLPLQEQFDIQSYQLAAREAVNTAVPFSTYQLPERNPVDAASSGKKNYIFAFNLNYSNELLLTRALEEIGYKKDMTVAELNNSLDEKAKENGRELWTNEIAYSGADGKRLEGTYFRESRFGGVIIEATDFVGFAGLNLSAEDAEKFANVIREFGVDVVVNEAPNKTDIMDKTSESGEHEEKNPLEENVKQWYTTTFPNDNVGTRLNDNVTFVEINESVFNPTEKNANIYEILGSNVTSEVRDRVFTRLAEIKGVTYDDIFKAWSQFDYPTQIAEQEKLQENNSIYYPINEEAAKRAQEANSYSDYVEGTATAQYRQSVDKAVEIAEQQKKRVDPMHHQQIDALVNIYARKLAENLNSRFAIEARMPSYLITGGGNFQVGKKKKQNAARDKNDREWQEIQGLLDKIRSTGNGGISSDDPNSIQKLEAKLASLEKSQETMKAVNAYYRTHKTLEGCPNLTKEQLAKLREDIKKFPHLEGKPYASWQLSNNNAEIHRIRSRIQELKNNQEVGFVGWVFDGGEVQANVEANRLQIVFDERPDEATRSELKSNGFRWSPTNSAWQRQLNGNAYYAANRISAIQPTDGSKPTDLQRAHVKRQKQTSEVSENGEHKEKMTLEEARNAMLDAHDKDIYHYAVVIENMPHQDPEDGYESEEPAQNIYVISNDGTVDLWRTEPLDGYISESTLPYAYNNKRLYERVEYDELGRIAEQMRAHMQTYMDVLKAEDESNGKQIRNQYYYQRRAMDVLEEHYNAGEGAFVRNLENPKYLSKTTYADRTRNGYKVLSITQDDANRNIAVVQRKNDFMVAVGYNTDDGMWEQGYYDFKDQKAAEEFRQKEYPTQNEEKRNDKMSVQNRTDNHTADKDSLDTASQWISIKLPNGSVGNQYGKTTMIKMPEGEFSHYSFFVPTTLLREYNGQKVLRVSSDHLFRINNDGRQVELTGQELYDSFAGKHLDKTYKRVAPSRKYAQGLANLEKNVPAELKEIPTWCCYRTRWNEEKGKKDKFIISPIDGKWTSSKEPGKWVTFDAAMKYARENNCEGLSVLLDKKYGITCIDLDKCIEAETGKLNERASKLVEALSGTYIERSTSGNGLHIFVKDDILKNGQYNMTSADKNKGDLEVYDDKRIMSLTGDMYSKGNTLTRAGSAATVYLRQELGERRNVANNGAKPHPTGGLNLSDNELIHWIQSSKQGSKFNDLYNGRGVSGNRSDDDAKLAHMVLYFNGGDKDQTFRIMRESGIYRPDKPDSYYRATIDKMDAKISEYAKRPTSSAGGPGKPKGKGPGNSKPGSQA